MQNLNLMLNRTKTYECVMVVGEFKSAIFLQVPDEAKDFLHTGDVTAYRRDPSVDLPDIMGIYYVTIMFKKPTKRSKAIILEMTHEKFEFLDAV